MRQLLALACLLTLLSGCILVDRFGHAWDEAKPDTCLTKIAQSLYYAEYRRDPEKLDMRQIARGWTLDGHHYLLLKQAPEDAGGRLYRFTVTQGIFQRFRLNPTMRATFEKNFPHAPVSLHHDTVRLDALTPETETLLRTIASLPDYWEIEDQALYNPLRNTACRFDDRDLSVKE